MLTSFMKSFHNLFTLLVMSDAVAENQAQESDKRVTAVVGPRQGEQFEAHDTVCGTVQLGLCVIRRVIFFLIGPRRYQACLIPP